MPKPAIQITATDSAQIVRILTPNGKEYFIKILDIADSIEVTVSGLMDVHPQHNAVTIYSTEF